MISEQRMLYEHGVSYVHLNKDQTAPEGMVGVDYNWWHLPTGITGTGRIAMPFATGHRALDGLRILVNNWNRQGGKTWKYSI